jgi:WD40 repeat protein
MAGVPSLLIGLQDGRILIRAVQSMILIACIESSVANTGAVWSIVDLKVGNFFATAGEDGALLVWEVKIALKDS